MKQVSLIIVFSVLLLSCEKIKNKITRLKSKTKSEIKEQKDKVFRKVFPPFDAHQADTENNKARFKDFVQIELSPDIQNIYCFDDALGIDADYMFAFTCDSMSSQKIISEHHLKLDSTNTDNGFGIQNDFDWWNKKRISKLPKYIWTDGNQYFKYYWYDSENQKAYFFDFDL